MIVNLSSPAKRGGLVFIAVAVGIYLTYFSVRTARATYYTGLETLYGYERATQIEPENALNWYLLGRYLQYSLEDANPERAISSYLTSLRIEPQATVTWMDLAATYETEGNVVEARSAFLNAKKTYPASAEVSWRYGNFLLRQGELEPAFTEIRHSVETDPLRAPEAFSRCVRIEPDADVILDRVIPANREVYIAVMHDLIGERQADNALKVWKRLVAMHAEVPMSEIFGLVSTLRQMGRGPEAHELWMQGAERAGLGDLQGPKDSPVWDGGFETDNFGVGLFLAVFHGGARGTNRARPARTALGKTVAAGVFRRQFRHFLPGSLPDRTGEGRDVLRAFRMDADEGADDGQGSATGVAAVYSRRVASEYRGGPRDRGMDAVVGGVGGARKRIRTWRFACGGTPASRKITRSGERCG